MMATARVRGGHSVHGESRLLDASLSESRTMHFSQSDLQKEYTHPVRLYPASPRLPTSRHARARLAPQKCHDRRSFVVLATVICQSLESMIARFPKKAKCVSGERERAIQVSGGPPRRLGTKVSRCQRSAFRQIVETQKIRPRWTFGPRNGKASVLLPNFHAKS